MPAPPPDPRNAFITQKDWDVGGTPLKLGANGTASYGAAKGRWALEGDTVTVQLAAAAGGSPAGNKLTLAVDGESLVPTGGAGGAATPPAAPAAPPAAPPAPPPPAPTGGR